jgi:hypothetical protein
MTQDAQELLKKTLALPDKERADPAGNWIDSLKDTGAGVPGRHRVVPRTKPGCGDQL